jgi:tetratricopeptide (TPR) repeat protein
MALPVVESLRQINTLLQAGRFSEAQEQLQAVVAAHPDCVEALRLLAGTRQIFGDPEVGEELLRRALALDGKWTPTLASLGELLLVTGRFAEAEPLLRRALEGSTPSLRAAVLLARYYNDTGRRTEAIAVTAPWWTRGLGDSDLNAQHVSALMALGRHQEALTGYQKLVDANPGNLPAVEALAVILNAMGRTQEAGQLTSRSLARGQRSAALFRTHARSLQGQGALVEAEDALRECIKLEPRRAEAHTALAQLVWTRTGDVQQATETLTEALRAFSQDEALWAAKASVLQAAGDSRAAYDSLAPLIDRERAQPSLLVRAALAALDFEPSTAAKLSERALHAAGTNAPARTVLAAAQLGTGDAESALSNCEQLLLGTPDDQYLIALQTTAWRLLGDERYAQYCDYGDLVLPRQLEAPAPWTDMESFLGDVRASLQRVHDPNGHALLFQSLRNGTETMQDLVLNTDPAIRALFKAFETPIRDYLEHIGHGPDPLRRRNKGRFRFHGSWSVRLRSSGYHTNHVHPRGWISSACYIELPDSMADETRRDGILSFGEPSLLTLPPLAPEYSVRPRNGMLVLFPSYVWHGTVPFSGEQARLTVAFDLIPER